MTRVIHFLADAESRKENLKNYINVEDLLDELGVDRIRESGGEIWASCPFHNDSGRHWSVNIDTASDYWGVHSCFVCRESGKKAGNLVTLVRDLKGLRYDTALVWLEAFAGISGDEKGLQEMVLSRRIKPVKAKTYLDEDEEDPSVLYHSMRILKPDSDGWKYLVGRGVSPEQIQEYGGRSGNGRYENRIVFPIVNDGKVVNFYARAFDNSRNKGLYAKKKGTISTSMFGYDKVNKFNDTCYIVEGVFDVLAIRRIFKTVNVVATGGSILYPGQAKFLQYFRTIIVVPDMKGKAASILPSCKKLLRGGNLKVVDLPKGYDIDDFCRKYPVAAERLLGAPGPAYHSRVTTVVNYTVTR